MDSREKVLKVGLLEFNLWSSQIHNLSILFYELKFQILICVAPKYTMGFTSSIIKTEENKMKLESKSINKKQYII